MLDETYNPQMNDANLPYSLGQRERRWILGQPPPAVIRHRAASFVALKFWLVMIDTKKSLVVQLVPEYSHSLPRNCQRGIDSRHTFVIVSFALLHRLGVSHCCVSGSLFVRQEPKSQIFTGVFGQPSFHSGRMMYT